MRLAEKYVFSSSTVAKIDNDAIRENGPEYGFELMRKAAKFSFEILKNKKPESIIVFCGSGNNAGDGYLLATFAIESGLKANVMIIDPNDNLKGDAKRAKESFLKAGGKTETWSSELELTCDWIVDAIFGIGINRDLDNLHQKAIQSINESKSKVLSIDIPSGLCGNTGKIFGEAVSADITTTYVGKKSGLYLDSGPNYAGTIHFSDLNIDECFYSDAQPQIQIVSDKDKSDVLTRRNQASHKGDHGHVLLIGGNKGMEGAIRIASEASLRSGSGLVSVLSTKNSCQIINQFRPEVMCHDASKQESISSLIDKADIIGIGPGLGTDDWAVNLYNHALESEKHLVVDADALNILSSDPIKRGNWTLTPHPGEAARLLSSSVSEIQEDRLSAIAELTKKYSANVLLKGKFSLIKDSVNDIPCMITSGNPGMATAGMGDLLTGVISSLLGQYGTENSGKIISIGAHIHSKSGDLASLDGERGLIASDLLPYIRQLVNS